MMWVVKGMEGVIVGDRLVPFIFRVVKEACVISYDVSSYAAVRAYPEDIGVPSEFLS